MSQPSSAGGPYRLLAWVGIVAGIVFIVATVFVAGMTVAWSSGGHQGWHHRGDPGSSSCPMMDSGTMMGPGPMMGPGRGMAPMPAPNPVPPPR